jgi:AsmA protein
VSARGKIELNASGEIPTYTASLELPSFDPRALLDHLGQAAPETGDPKALTRLSASAVVTGSGTDLILEPLTLKLDDTQVTGTLSVSDGLSESRAMKFDLRADALDSGRYLPFTFPGTEQEAPTLASLGALWSLDLNGRLRLEALTVGDVIIDDVEVVARSRSGRLELQSGSVSPRLTPGGRIAASASLTQPPS